MEQKKCHSHLLCMNREKEVKHKNQLLLNYKNVFIEIYRCFKERTNKQTKIIQILFMCVQRVVIYIKKHNFFLVIAWNGYLDVSNVTRHT